MGTYLIWKVKELAEQIRRMQANKFDCIMVVDGNRGLGKSTFMYQLARKIGGFRPKRDIVFSREDVLKQLATKESGIIVADEMINVTYNRDFYNEDQKKLLKCLNMYRDRKNILLCAVPKFATLDKQFLGLTKLRVNIIRHGVGVLHRPRQNAYSVDPWDIKVNEMIERKWSANGILKPKYKRLTTYVGFIKYRDLGPKSREVYERIKKEKRNDLMVGEVSMEGLPSMSRKVDTYSILLKNIKEGKVNREMLRQMCEIQGIEHKTLVSNFNFRLRKENSPHSLSSLLKQNEGKEMKKVYAIARPKLI